MSETNNLDKDKQLRMRYYQSIKGKGEFSDTFITPTQHWLNPNLFVINQTFDETQAPKKNKSWVTILSVWNTMIGSSIVSLPYYTKNAGIIPTILLNIIYGLICFYTCQVILKTGGKDNDYSDTVHRYIGPKFGKFGRYVQIIFNLMLNIGAIFIYFLIINQNLYPNFATLLNLIGANLDATNFIPSFSNFSSFYCGIILCIVMFPLLIMKDISFLIKINSYGIYFVSVLLGFVLYTGFSSLFTSSYDFEYKLNKNVPDGEDNVRHLYLFGDNPSMLAGSLTLGYFSHSVVLSLFQNNEKQENNKRDLFYGYCLVCLTYILIGILGYIGFSGHNFDAEFKDNWFIFFSPNNIFILFLRLLSVFQLCTIFPIIFYVVRIQLFGSFYKNNYPSRLHIILFCSILLFLSLLVLYTFYDQLGKLMSVIGASTGLVLIFIIPLIVNIVYYNLKHPDTEIREKLMINDTRLTNGNEDISIINNINLPHNEILNGPHIISTKTPSKLKDNLFYISQYLLMALGVFTLIIQFVKINFFNIHFDE